MRKLVIIGGVIAGALTLLTALIFYSTRAPDPKAEEGLFVISRTNKEETVKRLLEGGYIRHSWSIPAARLLTLRFGETEPGGYKISKSMNTRKLITILTSEPQLKWITIPEGLRKEEIGERLAKELEVNLSLKLEKLESGKYKVSGKGELHLAVLLETLRREGYEVEVGKPEVILADEPTGNLDPDSAFEILKLFKEINLAQTTVIVATHNVELVNKFKERVIELKKGKIVRDEKKGKYVAD